jgi:pilus assembly protein Flp/PilA
MKFLRSLIREEEAATAVEYAVLLALILMAVFGAIGSVGAGTGGMWGSINNDMVSAGMGS